MAPPKTKKQGTRASEQGIGSESEETPVVDVDIVDKSGKQPEKLARQNKKKDCPYLQSLGVYWLKKCSDISCGQKWHTTCANLLSPWAN